MRAVIAVDVLERSRRLSGPGTAGRRGPRPTSGGAIVDHVRRPGGRWWIEGDRLHVSALPGILTPRFV
jgi:hypothetical protein